jgi:hypothetical protein
VTYDFSECVAVDARSDLQQGDIVEFESPVDSGPDILRRWGIIVTADCDLARHKHRGYLSYVPILTVDDYVSEFLLPKLVEDFLDQRQRGLSKMFREFEKRLGPQHDELSDRALKSWAEAGKVNEIAQFLQLTKAIEIEKMNRPIAEIRLCLDAKAMSRVDERLTCLLQLFAARKSPMQALKEEIDKRLLNLPGDAFFLRRLPSGLSAEPEADGGYIVYLRLIREIQMNHLAKSYRGTANPLIVATRVGRLGVPYVYRLTQQLAEVFAAIGLPDEYDKERKQISYTLTRAEWVAVA